MFKNGKTNHNSELDEYQPTENATHLFQFFFEIFEKFVLIL